MLGAQGPEAGQMIIPSLRLYFLLCTFCRHTARHRTVSYSLGSFMLNTEVWSWSSWFILLMSIVLSQTLKEFVLVISIRA